MLVETLRLLVHFLSFSVPRRLDEWLEIHCRRKGLTSLGVYAIAKLSELPFHATSVSVPGRLALALTHQALGLMIGINAAAVAP